MHHRVIHFVRRGILVAAAISLAAWALFTLRWQGDLIDLFPADLPAVRDLRAMQARGSEDFSLLGVVDPGAEDSGQLAARLARVADALNASPLVAKADVLTDPSKLAPEGWAAVFIGLPTDKFVQFAKATNEAEVRARLQAAREALSGWPDAAVWARIHYDPLGLADWVVSPATAESNGAPPTAPNPILRIEPKVRANTLTTAEPLVTAVRAALAANGFAPGRIALTGEAAYVTEIGLQMRREMIGMTLSSGALIALVFLIAYRSWFPLVALFALQAAGLLAGLLVARIIWGSINLFSVAFASVALGLCSDYGAVVYHHFAKGGRKEGESWRTLRRSLIFCVLTTAVGLGGLAASALPGLRQFAVLINVCLIVVAALAIGPWASWVEHHLHLRAQTVPPAEITEPEQPAPVWLRQCGWLFLVGGWLLLGWSILHREKIYDFSWSRMSPPGLEAQHGQDVLSAYLPVKFISGDERAWAANRQTWAARTSFDLGPVFTAEGFQPNLAVPYQNLFHSLDGWSHGDPALEIWSRGSTAFARLQS
ncbi:MAG TPA: MMPL family transporter, partial [Opitutales bacterium]|nr:MMPL family transporter [Opitutales bacterium]